MNTVRALSSVVAIALLPALSHAQTLRAECDNRSGTTLANLSNSSGNPNTNGYNIDPSAMYITINGPFNSSQTSGSNSAVANLSVKSQFFGTNPATRMYAFTSTVTGSATVHRTSLTAMAESQDNTSICVAVSGASASTPEKVRIVASSTLTGSAATASFRFSDPANSNIISLSGNDSINRVLHLTSNGNYTFQMQGDTTELNVSTGTATVADTFSNAAAITCVADYNADGAVTVQDIFSFLSAWFAKTIGADTNADGNITVQDIFEFLNAWFTGCS